MPPFINSRMVLSRLLVLTWLISWVSTIPLFHVHLPDPKERLPSLQSGIAHTVFSPDLPGEFSHFSIARDHRSPFLDLSQRVLNSPELGFAVLNNLSKDRKVREATVLGSSCCPPTSLQLSRRSIEVQAVDGSLLVHGPPPPSRAPPLLTSI